MSSTKNTSNEEFLAMIRDDSDDSLPWLVIGNHPSLGDGVLTSHRHRSDAQFNVSLIKLNGGKAKVKGNKNTVI